MKKQEHKVISSEQEKLQQTNRSTRRKFLKLGAAASPLLMAVKSPTAWAGGDFGGGQCSVSVLISGNPSAPQCQSDPKSPGYWHRALSAPESSPHYAVRQALFLNTPSITGDSLFNDFFLQGFQVVYRGWTATLSISSDNPNFTFILPENGNGQSNNLNLLISFSKPGESLDDLDIALAANFHMLMLAAYLNSQFYPAVINYGYEPNEIIAIIRQFITECIFGYLDAVENGEQINLNDIIKSPWEILKTELEKW